MHRWALPCLLLVAVAASETLAIPATTWTASTDLGVNTTVQTGITNPIDPTWYADPDASKFGDTFWIYATVSDPYENQAQFDALESKDLVTWTKHIAVFSRVQSYWAKSAFWAPAVTERHGLYYFYYTANNPVADPNGVAGIGVARASTPGGPFHDVRSTPIVQGQIAGGNAMDPSVFVDDDGTYYLIWGGTRAFIQPLARNMIALDRWRDGSAGPRDITPSAGFVEAAYMIKRRGTYYLSWSEGSYGDASYSVAYAMAGSITGPFVRIGKILQSDGVLAEGPGSHSILRVARDDYRIVYHRRIVGDTEPDHRLLAIDRLVFAADGTILPIKRPERFANSIAACGEQFLGM
ncbi:family 43 glycoside hydrolase [Xylariomycetidae sp. FL2044]|nr:family 43 glycoside hydrolase [Xylariomycetidae sp. FL2044]